MLENLSLFFRSLWGSWLAWAGGILRMIPFFEGLVEPWVRGRFPKADTWFASHGAILKKNLKLIGLVCLFIGCYRAWVFEHRNAENAMYGKDGKSEAWSRYNECDKESAVEAALVETYSSQLAGQQGTLDREQDTFNRCVMTFQEVSIPERQKVTIKQVHVLSIPDLQGKFLTLWMVLAFTNKTITPARGELICPNNFLFQSFEIAEDQKLPKLGFSRHQLSDTQVKFSLQSPTWKPDSPSLFSLATVGEGSSLGACSLSLD